MKIERKIGGVKLADKMKKGLTTKFLKDVRELKKSRVH